MPVSISYGTVARQSFFNHRCAGKCSAKVPNRTCNYLILCIQGHRQSNKYKLKEKYYSSHNFLIN